MSEQTILVNSGHTHPDLFDGETPLLIEIAVEDDLKVYEVTVGYVIPESVTVTVVADSESFAIAQAYEVAEHRADPEAEEFDVQVCDLKEEEDPSETQLKNFYAYQERLNAVKRKYTED